MTTTDANSSLDTSPTPLVVIDPKRINRPEWLPRIPDPREIDKRPFSEEQMRDPTPRW
jgi:hypothetical protein